MNRSKVADLSAELADHAENFCRSYFPEGRKQGNYWQIDDTTGSTGQMGRCTRRDASGLQARLEKPRQSSTVQAYPSGVPGVDNQFCCEFQGARSLMGLILWSAMWVRSQVSRASGSTLFMRAVSMRV